MATGNTGGAACGSYKIDVQGCTASGTNSTAISSPHIVQYPKPPKRVDGKWMALSGLIGGIIGKMAASDKMDEADGAEGTWKTLLAEFTEMAYALRCRSNAEYEYALELNHANDTLHERLFALVSCGYRPDYEGILARAQADTQIAAAKQREQMCREQRRYNVGANSYMATDIARAATTAVIGAVTTAREKERQFMWSTNTELYFKGAKQFEDDRETRLKTSTEMMKDAGDMMASAAKSYAFLAESLRRSAEKDAGGIASLITSALLVWTLFTRGCELEEDCDCKGSSGGGGDSGTGGTLPVGP